MTDYTIAPARLIRSDKWVIHCPSSDGFTTRAGRLAGTFGRWSGRQNGYVVTEAAARRFCGLYAAGWDASVIFKGAKSRIPPEVNKGEEHEKQHDIW